jgi:hypothetical protein
VSHETYGEFSDRTIARMGVRVDYALGLGLALVRELPSTWTTSPSRKESDPYVRIER